MKFTMKTLIASVVLFQLSLGTTLSDTWIGGYIRGRAYAWFDSDAYTTAGNCGHCAQWYDGYVAGTVHTIHDRTRLDAAFRWAEGHP